MPSSLNNHDLGLPALKIPPLVARLHPEAQTPDVVKNIDWGNLASITPPELNIAPPALSALQPAAEPQTLAPSEKAVQEPAKTDAAPNPETETATSPANVSDILKAALDEWQSQPATHADEHKLHNAMIRFYTARNFEPLWSHTGQWSVQAHAALGRVERAREDGLDLGTLPRPALGTGTSADVAKNDILLTDLIIHYAAQAMGSRIDPLDISKLITAKPTPPDFTDILNHIASADDAGTALQATNPPQKAYADLRAKLAELRRESRPMVQAPIPTGPILKIGMKDARVPLIRERFGLSIEPNNAGEDIIYDMRVAAAVANFQTNNGLPASGTLTPRTISALSGGEPARLEAELIANMEVWRWLPRDMGHDRIEVNLTEFAARLYRDDKPVYFTKVVVGKPTTPTPVFPTGCNF